MAIRRHARTPPAAPPETGASVQEYLDNSVGAFAMLQDEQRLIADELEATFLAYDKRLKAVAKRLAYSGEGSVTPEERSQLREEQLELWRLLRRAQAAERSTRELIREAAEWRVHEPTDMSEGHPDHPDTRVEIVESELRVRGVGVTDGSYEPEPEDPLFGIHWLHRVPEQADAKSGGVAIAAALPEWEHDTDEYLLREIHQYERELARARHPADVADALKGLRTLHGYLRVHDRRVNRSRIRYTLGLGTLRH